MRCGACSTGHGGSAGTTRRRARSSLPRTDAVNWRGRPSPERVRPEATPSEGGLTRLMSTDQPAPGPEDARPEPPAGGEPPPGPPTPPPGPEGGSPYGAAPPPPQAEVRDPLAEMPPLADRWRRLVARIIDALIIGIPISVVVALAWGGYDVNDTGRSATQDLVYGFVYFVYEGLMLT